MSEENRPLQSLNHYLLIPIVFPTIISWFWLSVQNYQNIVPVSILQRQNQEGRGERVFIRKLTCRWWRSPCKRGPLELEMWLSPRDTRAWFAVGDRKSIKPDICYCSVFWSSEVNKPGAVMSMIRRRRVPTPREPTNGFLSVRPSAGWSVPPTLNSPLTLLTRKAFFIGSIDSPSFTPRPNIGVTYKSNNSETS